MKSFCVYMAIHVGTRMGNKIWHKAWDKVIKEVWHEHVRGIRLVIMESMHVHD